MVEQHLKLLFHYNQIMPTFPLQMITSIHIYLRSEKKKYEYKYESGIYMYKWEKIYLIV